MGRPKKEVVQPEDKYVIRFPDGMRDELKAAAKSNNRSMNAEIIARLELYPILLIKVEQLEQKEKEIPPDLLESILETAHNAFLYNLEHIVEERVETAINRFIKSDIPYNKKNQKPPKDKK